MQRPKPGETEEDLLRFQTEFLKSTNTTQNVSLKHPDKRKHSEKKDDTSKTDKDIVQMEGVESSAMSSTSNPTPSKKSKVLSWKDTSSSDHLRKVNEDDMEEMMDRKETGLAAVLTTIIERDTRNQMVSAPGFSKQAFPSVLLNDGINKATESGRTAQDKPRKKKSLFAQHIESKTAKEFGVNQTASSSARTSCSMVAAEQIKDGRFDSSFIVDGKGLSASSCTDEALKIHQENLDKLSSMTQTEIIEEQQKLIQSIDPNLVGFLKKKRQDKEVKESKSVTSEVSAPSSFSVLKARKKKESTNKEPESTPPIKPEGTWVNMDTVEKDKMEWMSDLPPPRSTSSETGKPARFDFEGNLLAVDVDIPVREGLHHHGEEPERAGYTLQELFILARSSNLQQRALSLHTLARIIRKAKSGDLCGKTEGSVLPVLLDGGLVLLLRWAFDDSVEAVIFAAVDALHALVWSPLDEEAIDSNWPTFLGHVGVALTPTLTLEKWSEPAQLDEENKEEETDGDMMKRDIIEALVRRTHLLTRINFVLDSMRPQALVVVQMLTVLCRVAQHSSNLAYEIVKCPGLLDRIVKEFLPTAWNVKDMSIPVSEVYGLPVHSALRLLRCLAQTGRNMAASLISKYSIPSVILRYLAVDSSNLHLPILEASNIQKEAMALWKVLASYGFLTQTFFDLYEVVVRKIGHVSEVWEDPSNRLTGSRDSLHQANLVCVLDKVVGVVDSKNIKESELHRLPVDWSHVTGFFLPIKTFTVEALQAIGTSHATQKQDLTLPTSCLNFLATFYDKETKQPRDVDQVSRLEEAEALAKDCLVPFLSSYGLTVMRERLSSYSNVLSSSTWTAPSEITSNLPSLNVSRVCDPTPGGDKSEVSAMEHQLINIPSLRPHCPFAFLVALYRLVLSMCRKHKTLISQLLPGVVDNPDTLMYFKKVCQCRSPSSALGSSVWTRTENLLHFYWLKACVLKPCADMSLAHRISLRLLSRLSKGDEFLVHDLMTTVIFTPSFLGEGGDLLLATQAISSLSLSESLYLRSATQEDIHIGQTHLLKEAHGQLAAIRGHFLMALAGMERDVVESRGLYSGESQSVQSLVKGCDGEGLVPLDWMFLPLIHVYNKATQLKSAPGGEITSKDVSMVTSVLQWAYLLEIWRAKELEHISLATRLSRVMCAFIAGNDLFLEKSVQKYLAGLFRELSSPRNLDRLNLEEKVPGISSFYDLYQEVLEHYESVSFGDPVFCLYVLLPLQQRHGSLYRKAVWGERRGILRSLQVNLHQMLLPVEGFLYPEESDVELLGQYLQALTSGSVQLARSPVLFLVAVHHLNRFLFISSDDGNVPARQLLWKRVTAVAKKLPVIIYYKNFNPSLPDGIECYDVLPGNRQDIVNKHTGDIKC